MKSVGMWRGENIGLDWWSIVFLDDVDCLLKVETPARRSTWFRSKECEQCEVFKCLMPGNCEGFCFAFDRFKASRPQALLGTKLAARDADVADANNAGTLPIMFALFYELLQPAIRYCFFMDQGPCCRRGTSSR